MESIACKSWLYPRSPAPPQALTRGQADADKTKKDQHARFGNLVVQRSQLVALVLPRRVDSIAHDLPRIVDAGGRREGPAGTVRNRRVEVDSAVSQASRVQRGDEGVMDLPPAPCLANAQASTTWAT